MFSLRNAIVSISILLFSATSSMAQGNDCTVDYKGFSSVIDGASPETKVLLPEKLTPPKKSGNSIVAGYVEHHVMLKSGIVVKYEKGGCDRYGYRFGFENVRGLMEEGDINAIMKRANQVVESLPVKSRDAFLSDWSKIKLYVLHKKTENHYEFNEKKGGYSISPANIDKKCPNYGDADCGVVLGFDAFSFYSTHTP